jgi:Protein of unknown function (DUF1592)/Protein of unknown function (DUF1595)/Protein of unknown function (DUF1588)/Protein of unknown function (DUF1585)
MTGSGGVGAAPGGSTGAGGSAGSGGSPMGPGGTGNAGTGGSGGMAGGAGALGGSTGTAGNGGSAAGGTGGLGNPVLTGPFYTRLQRLTKDQWERAVADILRLPASATVLPGVFPPARGTADFNNNERLLFVDLAAELALEAGAEAAAAQVISSTEALAKVYAGTDAPGFVRAVGRRAFRRPLTTEEETRYQAVFALGEKLYGAGFTNGAALVIRALLQSPKFLYRSELGPPGQPLDGYEVASKLSFALQGTTPSDELLDLAAAGGLASADGLEQAARSLLDGDRAAAVMLDFHGQLYRLDQYGARAAAPPSTVPATWLEMAEVTSRFFDSVFSKGEGLRAILTSTRFFVGPQLASFYGLDSGTVSEIEQRTLDSARTGFFMQVPFLWWNSTYYGSDPIRRGVVMNEQVLCLPVDDGHLTSPAPVFYGPVSKGQTTRTEIEKLTAACGTCHTNTIDPLGFAFEGFDGVGSARTRDNDVAVDTRGTATIDGASRTFTGAKDLMKVLADSDQAHACYAKKFAGYALQRDLVEGDRTLLTDLATVSRTKSLKEMIVSLVRSPAFRVRAEVMP